MEISTKSISQSLNLYSIFGYLLPGFFLPCLLIVDYDFCMVIRDFRKNHTMTLENLNLLDLKVDYILDFFSTGTMTDFKFIPFLIFIFFCYLLGHLVSAFSSFWIERIFLKNTFGFPSKVLISNNEVKHSWFFGNYRRPFTPAMKTNLKNIVNENFGYSVDDDDYYWLCYSYIITTRPYLASRVHHFVNLYGFSRNISAAIIMYMIIRLVVLNWMIGSDMDSISWFLWIFLGISAFFMFWNYLKLFKRQAIDIYYLFISVKKDSQNNIQNSVED